MQQLKTTEVARQLGTPYHRIASALRSQKLSPPSKDYSGDFIWTEADVEALRQALAVDRRRKSPVVAAISIVCLMVALAFPFVAARVCGNTSSQPVAQLGGRSMSLNPRSLFGGPSAPVMEPTEVALMLSHVLRFPRLFAEAREKIEPVAFDATTERGLWYVWYTATDIKSLGTSVLDNDVGRMLADTIRRAQSLPDSIKIDEADLSYLFREGTGFFARTFGPNAPEFSEAYGRVLLRRFLRERQIIQPLLRTVSRWDQQVPQSIGPMLQEYAREAVALETVGGAAPQSLAADLPDFMASLEAYRGREMIGLRTGMPQLDRRTLGLRGMIVLGAKPNVGKTALALQLGLNVVRQNADACLYVVSLELSRREQQVRALCNASGMDWTTLIRGNAASLGRTDLPRFTDEQVACLDRGTQWMAENGGRVCIDDRDTLGPDVTAGTILSRLAQFKQRCGATRALVVIDYLQLLSLPEDKPLAELEADKFRVRAVQDVVRGTRTDDNPVGDPVIVISESRKPSNATRQQTWGENLADLMGSARLAYAADAVLLYRRLDDDQEVEPLFGTKDVRSRTRRDELENEGIAPMMLTLAKGRDGMSLGGWPLEYNFRTSTFREMDRPQPAFVIGPSLDDGPIAPRGLVSSNAADPMWDDE